MSFASESEYRKAVSVVFENILKQYDAVDPDLLEADIGQGTLTIVTKGVKTILSLQPPVKQIWLAAASQGRAIHFSWNESQKKWLDDKSQGFELYSFLTDIIEKASGVRVELKAN
jgi:iron donor protein CyaY